MALFEELDEIAQRASELWRLGRDTESEVVAREGLARRPASIALWGWLAFALLAQGKYRDGWQAFEARPSRANTELRALSYPEWTGDPLGGRSILVCGEQGLGDEIMMARFVGALRDLGAGHITLACHHQNVRALQQLGADQVIPRNGGPVVVPKHDCWVLLGSLPHRLGVTIETLTGTPYLRGEARVRGGIGVVEAGNPSHANDAHRSMPSGLLQRRLPGAQLLSPQGDVQDSLDQLAGLDLLITVDTSWAHMAGALGVPCWLLLPAYGQDWRWGRGRSETPWYSTVRLFRQPQIGDWDSVVAEVLGRLAA